MWMKNLYLEGQIENWNWRIEILYGNISVLLDQSKVRSCFFKRSLLSKIGEYEYAYITQL